MPLPYKVAKSLDPVIYRNTAFDAWLATKKGKKRAFFFKKELYHSILIKNIYKNKIEHEEAVNQKAISVLQQGDFCWVKLSNNYTEKWHLAFVHNILHDSANVFISELNEQ
jgi:hypothetical protein